MAVRPTERRLPAGWSAADLGQAEVSPDGRFALVSYLTDPLAEGSLNEYVVFVLDPGAIEQAETYEWTVFETTEEDGVVEADHDTDDEGLFSFRPARSGLISVFVSIKDASDTVIHTLALHQIVRPPNQALEALLEGQLVSAALGGHLTTSRELINDLAVYIVEAVNTPSASAFPELPDLFVAAIVYKEALWRPKEPELPRSYLTNLPELIRPFELEFAAEELNGVPLSTIRVQLDNTLGVCQIQPQTIAMVLEKPGTGSTYTPWRDKPRDERDEVDEQIRADFFALPDEDKIDLYNLLRFPKSNIRACVLLLDRLKRRSNRWPTLGREQFLADEKAVKVIATEYNGGGTTSAQADAGWSDYGEDIVKLMKEPFIELVRIDGTEINPYKSYLGKDFTIGDAHAVARDPPPALTPRVYQDGDDIPAGKQVGDTIEITQGETVRLDEVAADLGHVLVHGWGWTVRSNLTGNLLNETLGVERATWVSSAPAHQTVGSPQALIRTAALAVGFVERKPRQLLSALEPVEVVQLAFDSGGVEFAKVADQAGNVLGWTARSNLADDPRADGLYDVIDDDARLRDEAQEYTPAGGTLAQGSYVVVNRESQDTSPPGLCVEVSRTVSDGAGGYQADPAQPAVWVNKADLVRGWADFKGPNAAWKGGSYIGQVDVVPIVGTTKTGAIQKDRTAAQTLGAYRRLLAAAVAAGHAMNIVSGFRTFAEQQPLYDAWLAYQQGTGPQVNKAAPPGQSNHQNGSAFDLNTTGFDGTPLYDWLRANAPALGFLRTVGDEDHHWEYRPADAATYGYKLPGVSP